MTGCLLSRTGPGTTPENHVIGTCHPAIRFFDSYEVIVISRVTGPFQLPMSLMLDESGELKQTATVDRAAKPHSFKVSRILLG